MSIRVFVYGTLKPGEVNYQRYCEGKVIAAQPAIALGQLFDLPLGYPAMIPGDNQVRGFLLTFTEPTLLTVLDELEDYNPQRIPEDNEYYRQQVTIYDLANQSLGQAWIYLMQPERVQRLGGTLISSGWWSPMKSEYE
jgi:gamma-glutamylcyclotransferase (GGCT)/AIG2-like uncharacterized protein YtfP